MVVELTKPAQDSHPKKTCCTVTWESVMNMAETVISKGLHDDIMLL